MSIQQERGKIGRHINVGALAIAGDRIMTIQSLNYGKISALSFSFSDFFPIGLFFSYLNQATRSKLFDFYPACELRKII